MFDQQLHRIVQWPLNKIALALFKAKIPPNLVTLTGLGVGLAVVPLLHQANYQGAMFCVLLNRLLDGLDGALARQGTPSDFGAFLDILSDMLFYAAFVFGMALAQPENALWSCLLLFSFMGTSTAFLADAIFANKRQIAREELRSFHFLSGLVEGTETFIFMLLTLHFWFIYKLLAIVFSLLCFITVLGRILRAYKTLRA